jgi:hypothetical protein
LAVLDLDGLLLHHHGLPHHQDGPRLIGRLGRTAWRRLWRLRIGLGLRVRNLGEN